MRSGRLVHYRGLGAARRAEAPISRIRRAASSLARVASLQALVQLTVAASGVIVVRALSVPDYARYTLAVSAQAILAILADSGIGSVVSAVGGRVCDDRNRFGRLVVTALAFRRRLELGAFILVVPALVWTLLRQGTSGWLAAACAAAVGLAVHFHVSLAVHSAVPRLLLDTTRLQRREVASALVRLLLVGLIALSGAGFVAMLCASTVAYAVQAVLVRALARRSVETEVDPDPEVRARMSRVLRTQLPGAVYYAFQPQITIALLAVAGTSTAIAELGALGRLGALFVFGGAVFDYMVVPRFSRVASPALLQRRYLQAIAAVAVAAVAVIGAGVVWPEAILWVLGGKYAHLVPVLVLMLASAALSQLVHAMWALNAARAWIELAWVSIPLTLVTQVVLALCLDLSSVRNALWFGGLSLVPNLVVNAWMSFDGLRRERLEGAEGRPSPATAQPAAPIDTLS